MVTWGTNPEMGVLSLINHSQKSKTLMMNVLTSIWMLSLANMLKISILAMSLLVLVLTHVSATLRLAAKFVERKTYPHQH